MVSNHEASVVASANEIAELKKRLGDTQKILADYEKNEIAFVRTQMMREDWLAGIGSHLVGYLATVVITALFMTWYVSRTHNNSRPKENAEQAVMVNLRQPRARGCPVGECQGIPMRDGRAGNREARTVRG